MAKLSEIMQVKDVVITGAELIEGTKVLIDAPGADKWLEVDEIIVHVVPGTVPMQASGGIQIDGNGQVFTFTQSVVVSPTESVSVIRALSNQEELLTLNAPVVLDNSANVTEGNSIFYVRFFYRIHSLTDDVGATSAKGYTTKTNIENYILQDIDAAFAPQIDAWIMGVERIIDQITGRNFIADSTASARLFDGDGTQELLIDEAVAVTKVEVGQDDFGGAFTEVSATGADRYFLDPTNYEAKGVPVHKVTLHARTFACGKQCNRITAKWGFSVEVPADIEFAATVFVAGILNQQRQGGEEIKSEKIGNYQVTYNTDNDQNTWADFVRAKEILSTYTKLNI